VEIKAQKDFNIVVKNNATKTVNNNSTYTIAKGNVETSVAQDYSLNAK